MQQDHGMLMRAAAEHDINHVTLGHAVTLIEANMDPGLAQETISLIHAAISPGHAVFRARRTAEPAPVEATTPVEEAEVEPQAEEAAHAEPESKPKSTRKSKPKA